MTADIEATYDTDIEAFSKDFGDHDYVRRPRLIRWLAQFGDSAPLGIKVLKNLRYFSTSNLMAMSQELVKIVVRTYPHIKGSEIYYIPVGGPGTGAQMIARHLRSDPNVPKANIVDLLKLHQESKVRKISVTVFLEDFSGTGRSIQDWWNMNAPIILPIGSFVLFGILVLNHVARSLLEEELTMIAIQHFDKQDNILSADCTYFDDSEKESLLSFCGKTGCSPSYLKGFGDCGLLVAFQHGCPNNSLPILWHEISGVWGALFRRRSV